MLLRIARLDRQFGEAIRDFMQAISRGTPLLQEIKGHIIHEGRETAIRRSASEVENTEMKEMSAYVEMTFDEIEAMDLPFIMKKVCESAEQFTRTFSMSLFQKLDETTAKTGQVMDARGEPLTNDHLIKMFEMAQINFERSDAGDLTIVTAHGDGFTF